MQAQLPSYEVEWIDDHNKTGQSHQYLVKWKGFTQRSWEPESNLFGTATDCIDHFHDHNPKASMSPDTKARRAIRVALVEHINDELLSPAQNAALSASANAPPVPPSVFDPSDAQGYSSAAPHRRICDLLQSLPSTNDELWLHLIPVITKLHIKSRPVLGLPPFMRMSRENLLVWGAAMNAAAARLKSAIDKFILDRNELDITNAVIDLLELPARELMPIMGLTAVGGSRNITFDDGSPSLTINLGPTPPPRDAKWKPKIMNTTLNPADFNTMQGQSTRVVHAAVNAIHKDKQKSALKMLLGNGNASPTLPTFVQLAEMHTKREGPIILPEIMGPQVQVSVDECYQKLLLSAGCKDAPIGVYGLSDGMFYSQRGAPKSTSLLWQYARLQALLGSADLPIAIYFMLTAGGLSALHKEDLEKQRILISQNKQAKLRPINSGSALLKTPLRVVAEHSSAKAARALMSDINMGDAVSAGTETITHFAAIHQQRGGAIGTEDCINAFGNLKRNGMLATVAEHWSEATSIYLKTYAHDSPCMYAYTDDEGNNCLGVTRSQEGSRMGCVLGSISFNLTAYHGVFKPLAVEFDKYTLLALTDDLTPFLPLAATEEEQHDLYDMHADYLTMYDRLGPPLGLYRHPDKGHLSIPAGWVDPKPTARIRSLTKITREGFKLAGVWIGTPQQVAAAAVRKVESLQPRMDAVIRLSKVNPQAAVRLVGTALNAGMDYYIRTTKPELIAEAIMQFDNMIMHTLACCITPDDRRSPVISACRQLRANELRKLPLGCGGMGHTPLALKAPSAYIAAAVTVLRESDLIRKLYIEVAGNLTQSYKFLLASLGADDFKFFPEIRKLIPSSPEAISRSPPSDNARSIPKFSAMRKVQGALVAACAVRSMDTFRHVYGADSGEGDGTSQSDLNHVQLVTSRSQLSRAYCATLFDPANRIRGAWFVNGVRYHLNLPQLVRHTHRLAGQVGLGDSSAEQSDFAVCAMHHEGGCRLLDPTGAHHAACISGSKARYSAHNWLNRTVAKYAQEAGGVTQVEPSTSSLLMNRLSPEQCRLLHSKTNTPQQLARKNLMLRMSDQFMQMVEGAPRRHLAEAMRRLSDETPQNWKGLRIDLRIMFKDAEIWLDVSSRHPTAASTTAAVTKWTRDLRAAETAALGNRLRRSAMERMPSPAVRTACAEKHKLYGSLVATALRQKSRGQRPFSPLFVAGVVSHSGEMAPEFINMVEIFTNQFRKHCTTLNLEDGVSAARRTAEYRTRFKDALMTATLGSFGRTLDDAGLAWERPDATPLWNVDRTLPSREGVG